MSMPSWCWVAASLAGAALGGAGCEGGPEVDLLVPCLSNSGSISTCGVDAEAGRQDSAGGEGGRVDAGGAGGSGGYAEPVRDGGRDVELVLDGSRDAEPAHDGGRDAELVRDGGGAPEPARDGGSQEDAGGGDDGHREDGSADSTPSEVDGSGLGHRCIPGEVAAPCNGCPEGTVVPLGFVCAPAGTFTQGQDGYPDAVPRDVTLSQPFFIQTTEVTQEEWHAFVGEAPFQFHWCGQSCPVEYVSWTDAAAFANARSVAEGFVPCYDANGALVGGPSPYNCRGYRLPTEAEWEYAYRAGTQTVFFWGDAEVDAAEYAWHLGSGAGVLQRPAGTRLPNAWGLHDMAGNLAEWVHDYYAEYESGMVVDPWGAQVADKRVIRGGSWGSPVEHIRAAFRGRNWPEDRYVFVGFRLVRSGVP